MRRALTALRFCHGADVGHDSPVASFRFLGELRERWAAVTTSSMRLMIAGICDGLALLVVIGLISPRVQSGRIANIVANVVLVPAALFATWSWWSMRRASGGTP
jgi:hypothetical protein